MSSRYRALLVILLLLASIETASAWDGKRKGFVLNAGPGLGLFSLNQSISGLGGGRENKPGLMTDVKIGYAPNEKLFIGYVAESAIMRTTNALGNDATFMQQVNGVGIVAYTQESAPSLFVSASAGLGIFKAFVSGTSPTYGVGAAAGVGYEIQKHLNILGGVLFTHGSETFTGFKLTTQIISARLMISFTGY